MIEKLASPIVMKCLRFECKNKLGNICFIILVFIVYCLIMFMNYKIKSLIVLIIINHVVFIDNYIYKLVFIRKASGSYNSLNGLELRVIILTLAFSDSFFERNIFFKENSMEILKVRSSDV